MRRTFGIGRVSEPLHLNSSSSSTACTSWILFSLFTVVLVIRTFLCFEKWFLVFLVCPQLSESCQLGKHTRVLFPKRLDQRTKSPFEVVHTNVWGPSRIESTLGFRYFVTLIDDYSRCTWLFLMKTRDELFSIF